MGTNSATWILNYESKPHVVGPKSSGSLSIRFQGVERTLVRSPSGRETLVQQQNVGETKDEAIVVVCKIPHAFLAGEELCNEYLAKALSKIKINGQVLLQIIPKICKDLINTSRSLGEEEKIGFSVEAQVEVVKETLQNNFFCPDDYGSNKGQRIPIEQDCMICLEDFSSGDRRTIMTLPCAHYFHRDCLLRWLRCKLSCPACRDDINNSRPSS